MEQENKDERTGGSNRGYLQVVFFSPFFLFL